MSQITKYTIGGTPGAPDVQFLEGNSGGEVGPNGSGVINVVGTGNITVTGNPGTNTLTISESSSVSDAFVTNSGTAVPAAGILNIVGGTNVTTSGSGNTVTITNTGLAGFFWNDETVSASMASNMGYTADSGAGIILTLPVSPAYGDVIRVTQKGTGDVRIGQNAGQVIKFGVQTTTTGALGYLQSTNQYDAIELLCIISGTTFQVLSSQGNWMFN
jgi:hypothetical protein